MRLVAYLRVSSGSQTDGYGLDVQRKDVTRWARANGHRIAHWHTETARGALHALDRPGLSDALRAVHDDRNIDGLVIPRLDRLARAVTVQEATLAIVWRSGGRVFTADGGEVMQDDPDDPMRTAMRQMVGVFSELERRMVVKRMRDGRAAKAAEGRHAVGAYAFGSKGAGKGRTRDAVPNPDEQAAVNRIVELRTAGQSYREIAATLDAEHIRPRRAEQWSPMAVRNVALRELGKAG